MSETAMHSRVAAWQDRLADVLAEEDARRDFDIAAYGGEIMSALETAGALFATAAPSPPAAAAGDSDQSVAAPAPAAAALDFTLVVSSHGPRPGSETAPPVAGGAAVDGRGAAGEAAAADAADEDEGEEAGGSASSALSERFEVCRAFLATLQVSRLEVPHGRVVPNHRVAR
jgi:hypothetical protein